MNPERSTSYSHHRRSRGFSLIEVLVAVLILGVALTGLTRGITVSLQSSRDAERHTTAVFLAESRIETLRAEGDFIEGEQTGEFEGVPGYGWRQSIRSADSEGLYAVRVDVLPVPKTAAPATGAGASSERPTSTTGSTRTSSGTSNSSSTDGATPGTPASRPYFTLETLLFKKPIASTLSSSGEETETERRRRRGEEARGRRREMR